MDANNLNPFDTTATFRVFNASPYPVHAKYNGYDIEIEPFQIFETPYQQVHDHLVKNHNTKSRGLVSYTFDNVAKEKYKTQEKFEREQAMSGLRNLERFFRESLANERIAVQDSNRRYKDSSDTFGFKVDEFQAKLDGIQKSINALLESHKKQDAALNQKEADKIQEQILNELGSNQNQSQKKVRRADPGLVV